MNKNILFLFFLVCSVYSLGQNSAYKTFDSLTINYGKILQGDNGTVDFKFTNTGDRDLKINKVRSSCGCTIPKKPDSLIAPGVSDLIKVNYEIVVPVFFIFTSLLLISKFPTYSFKKIVIQRKTTIFLLFGIVLFFGLILVYPFNVISISAIIYLLLLPISFIHYQKLKKQNEGHNSLDEDDDLGDIL